MPTNWKTSEDSDVFRIKDGKVVPLLKDEEGNWYEEVVPGSSEDPFSLSVSSLEDCLDGLKVAKFCIEKEDIETSVKLLNSCIQFLGEAVKGEGSPSLSRIEFFLLHPSPEQRNKGREMLKDYLKRSMREERDSLGNRPWT